MSNLLRLLVIVLLLTVTGALPNRAKAAPPSADTVSPATRVLQVQKKYQQLRSLEFDFAQTTQTGGRIKQGSGHATFYRSAKTTSDGAGIMRWNYSEPIAQIIINDGKELSVYTPQDKQLLVSPVQDLESDITYAIFTGTKGLLDEFAVSAADALFLLNTPPAALDAVLLIPREPHPQVKRIQLWLNADHTLHRLLMEDHFGALTELTFSQVRFNTLPANDPRLVRSLLQLDLAPGTEIIRQ